MESLIYSAVCQAIVAASYAASVIWLLSALTATLNIWLAIIVFLLGMALALYAHEYVAPHLYTAGELLTTATLPAYMAIRGLFAKKTITA